MHERSSFEEYGYPREKLNEEEQFSRERNLVALAMQAVAWSRDPHLITDEKSELKSFSIYCMSESKSPWKNTQFIGSIGWVSP